MSREIDIMFGSVKGAIDAIEHPVPGYRPFNYLRLLSKKQFDAVGFKIADDVIGARAMLEAGGDEGAYKLLKRAMKPLAKLTKETTAAAADSEFMAEVDAALNS